MSCFMFTLPALQKINHRLQLMSPIMASWDCPFIIPLIISIIIIIISLLQFITLCSKEDSIMFREDFFLFVCFFFFIFFYFAVQGKVHTLLLQLHLQSKKKKKESANQPWGKWALTGLGRQRSVKFGRSHQSEISELLVCLIWENCASTGLHSLKNRSGANFKAHAVGTGSNQERLFTGKMPRVSTVTVQTTVGCLCSFPSTGNQTDRVAYSETRADARSCRRWYFPISV